ncbi:barstar family protein [Streptomyces sp. NPDC014864]|uniref:barstar family protein n=1 Tax=Streptomyces sp. NPDC014864 TaxID=3364924 RepID=UPI0036F85DB5
MDRCVRALALPDWFGRNWDALADSLSDSSVWPGAGAAQGLLVVVRGRQPYAKARPKDRGDCAGGVLPGRGHDARAPRGARLGRSSERPADQPGRFNRG